jgi:Gas vesicle synthesis protein GvpO
MAKTTARERRAEARGLRRAAAHDDSTVDEAVDAVESDPAEALRTAASAAIAAAAVAAARALAKRRHEEGPEDEVDDAEGVEDDVPADEPEEDDQRDDEQDEEPEESAPRDSVSSSEARRIVEQARRQLSELHGADAESVSAVRRIADGWRIGLEVVEVRRIPESTDVLATYEVELDDNGDLITFERTTRYYRSEADRR